MGNYLISLALLLALAPTTSACHIFGRCRLPVRQPCVPASSLVVPQAGLNPSFNATSDPLATEDPGAYFDGLGTVFSGLPPLVKDLLGTVETADDIRPLVGTDLPPTGHPTAFLASNVPPSPGIFLASYPPFGVAGGLGGSGSGSTSSSAITSNEPPGGGGGGGGGGGEGGGGGNGVVPEPSSIVLMMTALAGWFLVFLKNTLRARLPQICRAMGG